MKKNKLSTSHEEAMTDDFQVPNDVTLPNQPAMNTSNDIEQLAKDMDRSIKCLALELPEPVWQDVNNKWQAFKAEFPTLSTELAKSFGRWMDEQEHPNRIRDWDYYFNEFLKVKQNENSGTNTQ